MCAIHADREGSWKDVRFLFKLYDFLTMIVRIRTLESIIKTAIDSKSLAFSQPGTEKTILI